MSKPLRRPLHLPGIIDFIILLIVFIVVVLLNLKIFNFDIRGRAVGVPANIIVSTQTIGSPVNTSFYHAFAQGGEESTDMIAPVTPQVSRLKPRFIRIDHIFDHYDVVFRQNGVLSFNFQKLDAAVQTIVSLHATPVLVLSYMPAAIAQGGNITNPPVNWADWRDVVHKTIEHFSGKYQNNLKDVYYEVWNEPDLDQFGSWKLSGDKNYLTLYQMAVIGAVNAVDVNSFHIGGPATTAFKKDWIIALAKSGSRIDFWSWHTYQPDPQRFASDQTDIQTALANYPSLSLLPQFITEFGFTGNKDVRYGSLYAATYTAAVVRLLQDKTPNALFSFELKDGPGQGSGDGWGILTHESTGGTPKPRYYVYALLDEMAGNRLTLSGEGTWVTGFASINTDVIRVLLVNYSQSELHSENVPVTVTGLASGVYTVRVRQLLGTDVSTKQTVSGSVLEKTIYLPSNSVTMVTLTKEP